jgi:hypothetical protein
MNASKEGATRPFVQKRLLRVGGKSEIAGIIKLMPEATKADLSCKGKSTRTCDWQER